MSSSRRPGSLGIAGTSKLLHAGTLSRTPSSRPGSLGYFLEPVGLRSSPPRLPDVHDAHRNSNRANAAETEVVAVIHARQPRFQAAGLWLRLVEANQWSASRCDADYEVVTRERARLILEGLARSQTAAKDVQAAFKRAASLLADPQSGNLVSGLLLLQRRPLRRFASSSPVEVVTPSQLARMVSQEKEETEHWIEIELVFPDGKNVVGERFRIITPDQREISGVTDSRGRARVDSIVAEGSCTIAFPDLHDDEWRLA